MSALLAHRRARGHPSRSLAGLARRQEVRLRADARRRRAARTGPLPPARPDGNEPGIPLVVQLRSGGEYTTPAVLRAFLNEAGSKSASTTSTTMGSCIAPAKAFERHAERINELPESVGRGRFSLGLHAAQSRLAAAARRALRRVDVRHRSVRAAARRRAAPSFRSGFPRDGAPEATSSCRTRCRRTRRCFSCWGNRRSTCGRKSSTGLRRAAAWRSSTCIPTT